MTDKADADVRKVEHVGLGLGFGIKAWGGVENGRTCFWFWGLNLGAARVGV